MVSPVSGQTERFRWPGIRISRNNGYEASPGSGDVQGQWGKPDPPIFRVQMLLMITECFRRENDPGNREELLPLFPEYGGSGAVESRFGGELEKIGYLDKKPVLK